jgi:carboxyl-terminal processing protease
VLPTLSDLPEFGEGALKNCLAYDEVPKARFTKWSEGRGLFIDELKRRSEARVQSNPEFHYVMEDMERLRKRLDENRISLNEDTRKAELNEDKIRKETRAKERLARHDEQMQMIRITLDNVDKPNIQPILFPGNLAANKKGGNKVAPEAAEDFDSDSDSATNDDGTKEPAIDPERDEALNILKDLVDLNRAPTTASTTASPPPPPN